MFSLFPFFFFADIYFYTPCIFTDKCTSTWTRLHILYIHIQSHMVKRTLQIQKGSICQIPNLEIGGDTYRYSDPMQEVTWLRCNYVCRLA